MAKRLALVLSALMIMLTSVGVSAEKVSKVNIRQVQPFNNALRVYADMDDSNGNAADMPEDSAIEAYLDSEKLMVQRVKRFSESGEGTAYIFLIDISGSINNSSFEKIKKATVHWAEKMNDKDRAAIVTFGNDAKIVRDYTKSSQEVSEAVNNITNNDGSTMLYGGLDKAFELIERTDEDLPKRKAVILLTDGLNEHSGITQDEIIKKYKDKTIPVYSIWNPGSTGRGESFVNRLTNETNGEKYNLSMFSVENIYETVYSQLKETLMIDLGYNSSYADEKAHSIKMSVWDNDKEIKDEIECVLKKPQDGLNVVPTSAPGMVQTGESEGNTMSQMSIIIIAAVVLLLLALIAVIVALLSKSGKKNDTYYQPIGKNVYSQFDANTPKPAPPVEEKAPAGRVRNTSGLPVTMTEIGGSDVKKGFLSGELLVGRNPECDIVISDNQTSDKHCRFIFKDGSMLAEDLNSTNGTTVNGMTFVGQTKVNSGDTMMFGNKEYRITF